MRWYVIRAKHHQERLAESSLMQLSVETFLPMLKQRKLVRRAPRIVVSPLFPGYLFARFDVRDSYRVVNFSRGVLKIVEFGLKPAEVSESLIEAIRAQLNEGFVIPAERFKGGQIVQIKGGPLAGLEGAFVKEMKGQHRVCLLLRALGLHAQVTMDIAQISLAQAL